MAQFQKGQSGNPGGRPLGVERMIRERLGDDLPRLIDALADIALGQRIVGTDIREPPDAATKDRIAAIKEIHDRIYGKPRQAIEVSSEGPAMLLEVLGLTTAQRVRRAADLEARVSEGGPAAEATDDADPG